MPQTNPESPWILTTNLSYTSNGKLQLGQILTDYTNPESAILTKTAALVDKNLRQEPVDQDVNFKSSKSIQTALKDWLEAVSSVGADSETKEIWRETFKTMCKNHSISALTFNPSVDYVKRALPHIDTSNPNSVLLYETHKRIWMVTGLRIVGKKPTIIQGFVNTATGRAEVEGVSSEAELSIHEALDVICKGLSPLVFAYRCKEFILEEIISNGEPF